ncbi:hypothetical protein [Cohnella massiliensis]|uniref:hypothetical protein n=1 Tax=Cohnella massiliensis TaxID=1816691 RepID=UPI0009B9B09F|nr:hypothetical protein [Cohnella massiliensis]
MRYELAAAFLAQKLDVDTLNEIVSQLAYAPLLYDNGDTIEADDFAAGLQIELADEARDAAGKLYDLAVRACRRWSGEAEYELLQDCLALQADLWRAGSLSIGDWMRWLERAGDGVVELPKYDFETLFADLPEGFSIHDFHDQLLYLLEERPDHEWAARERDALYERLGARSGA